MTALKLAVALSYRNARMAARLAALAEAAAWDGCDLIQRSH
jgi:hypothetical protein